MAVIAFSGADRKLLLQWSGIAHAAGHDSMLLEPDALTGHTLEAADLCVYDLGATPGIDLQRLKHALHDAPHVPFIAMSPTPTAIEGLELLQAGVRGYCNRLISGSVLPVVIASVGNGEIWAGRQVTDHLLAVSQVQQTHDGAQSELLDRLTDRETDIARQVAAGISNKVIAADSGISERTVKAHLNAIFRKTGITNRVQLALVVSQEQESQRRSSNG